MENKEFSLSGGVGENSEGQWRAQIKLTTPDGKITKISTGFIYPSEKDAKKDILLNIDHILSEFKKKYGVEVISRNGVKFQ